MYIIKTEIIRCPYYTLGGLSFTMILAMEILLSLTRASSGSSYTAEMSVGSGLNSRESCLFECFLLQNWWISVGKIKYIIHIASNCAILLEKETGTHQICWDVIRSKQCSGPFPIWIAYGSCHLPMGSSLRLGPQSNWTWKRQTGKSRQASTRITVLAHPWEPKSFQTRKDSLSSIFFMLLR